MTAEWNESLQQQSANIQVLQLVLLTGMSSPYLGIGSTDLGIGSPLQGMGWPSEGMRYNTKFFFPNK